MTILDTIVLQKKREVEVLRTNFTYRDFENSPLFDRQTLSIGKALRAHDFGIIAEIKRKSPSAGNINAELDVTKLGKHYEAAGATAISCLTDSTFFGGSGVDLEELRDAVNIPILRKEFIIDEIQLFEAKAIGADAILLISEILTEEEGLHLTIMAQQLGLEVIMECHDRIHLEKINDQVDIIGINNRNLHLQQTNLETSHELYEFIPNDKLCISESGIRNVSELVHLSKAGYRGALIGESILKNKDPKAFIEQLSSVSHQKPLIC